MVRTVVVPALACLLLAGCAAPSHGRGTDGGTPPDPGPTFGPLPAVSLFAGQSRTVTLEAADPDGEAITYGVEPGLPGWISLEGAALSFAPPDGTTFAKTITVTASDGHRLAKGILAVAVSPGRVTGTVAIDGGAAFTGAPEVTLSLAAHSTGGAVTTMALSNDGKTFAKAEPFAATAPWTLASGADGPRTVTVRLTDVNGATATIAGTIGLDTTPPTAGTVAIDGGAVATNTRKVTLDLTLKDAGSGPGKVCINSGTAPVSFTAPAAGDPCFSTPFAATVPYTLEATADGKQEVEVWFEDQVGNLDPTGATASIVLDRTAPTAPTGVSVVSVAYHTVTLAFTGSTDPAPSAGGPSYQVGFRLDGTTGPFVYAPLTALANGDAQVTLSAAHTFDLVVRAVDAAGNASAASAPVTATTYFPWTYESRRPVTTASGWRAAATLGGDHFAVVDEVPGEGLIDGGDGFATTRRLDVEADAIAPAGTSGRALFAGPTGYAFSADLGTTFWPITRDPAGAGTGGGTLDGAAWLGTTTAGGATTDRFVAVGQKGTLDVGSVLTEPGRVPTGHLTPVASGTTANLLGVAGCGGCTGQVAVAVGDAGTVLRTEDGGATWQVITSQAIGSTQITEVVSVPDSETMFATVGSGVFTSPDGGLTWTAIAALAGSKPTALAVSGSGTGYTLWVAAGSSGTPVLDTWDGSTETAVPLPASASPYDGALVAAAKGTGQGAEVVLGGLLGTLTDVAGGGQTVTARSSGPTGQVTAAAFADGSHDQALIATETGIRFTPDHGQTWTADQTGDIALPLRAIHLFADGSAVAVGAPGAVDVRTPSGQWNFRYLGSPNARDPVHDMSCLKPDGPCLIGGDYGSIFTYDPTTTVSQAIPITGWADRPTVLGVSLVRQPGGTVWGIAVADDSTYVTCKGATISQITCTGPTHMPSSSSSEVLQAVAVSDSGRAVVVGTLGPGPGGAADVFVDSNIFRRGGFTVDTSGTTGCGVDNFRVANVPGTKIWYLAGSQGLCRSDDDGVTWKVVPTYAPVTTPLATPVTPDPVGPALAVAPNPTGTSVLLGGDNGLVLFSATGGR